MKPCLKSADGDDGPWMRNAEWMPEHHGVFSEKALNSRNAAVSGGAFCSFHVLLVCMLAEPRSVQEWMWRKKIPESPQLPNESQHQFHRAFEDLDNKLLPPISIVLLVTTINESDKASCHASM